jgi:hypothetical protein
LCEMCILAALLAAPSSFLLVKDQPRYSLLTATA